MAESNVQSVFCLPAIFQIIIMIMTISPAPLIA
jgi:hypothetical protein